MSTSTVPATIPATMRALELHAEDGKPESLKLVEKPVPTPGPGEVLIKVAAAPVNPSDLSFLKGMYGTRKKLPVVPGFEGSGTVVAAGSGIVPRFYVGRRVAFVGGDGDGTWAEYAITSAMTCLPLPDNVSLEQGSMMMVNPLTALAFMQIAHDGHHKAIINTAAASALGKMLLALGLQNKLPIIHIVRSAEQVAALRSLGGQHVLNSTDADFDTALKTLARDLKATLACDAVAGDLSGRVLDAMPLNSEIMVYGGLSESAITVNPGTLIFQNKRVTGFWLPQWVASRGLPRMAPIFLKARSQIGSALTSHVQARLPLEAATQGLAAYAADMSAGKVIFVPGQK